MEEGDRSFNEQVQEVQQQILLYKECTNKKLKKLEEMMELVVHKMSLLKRNFKHQEDKIVDPFDWKEERNSSRIEQHSVAAQESLYHHNLQIPKFEGAAGVTDWLKDCEKCFEVLGVSDNKKAVIAGMHLEGVARRWYQIYRTGKTHLNWLDFSIQLCIRIGILEQEFLYENLWDGGMENNQDSVYTCGTKLKVEEPHQTESPDDYEFCKDFQKSDLSPENGAKYGALLSKEEWSDMDERFMDSQVVADMNINEVSEFVPESNISKGIHQYNVMQPSRKWKYVGLSAIDPHILPDYVLVPPGTGNSLTWSAFECGSSKTEPLGRDTSPNVAHFSLSKMFTEDNNMPVGNNSNEKFKMKGYSPFVNENDIYNKLGNFSKIGMSIKEAVYDSKPVLKAENAPFLELNDLSSPLNCPFEGGEIEWIQVGCIHTYGMKLWSSRLATGQGDIPKIVGSNKVKEQQGANEDGSSMIAANMRKVVETFPCKGTVKDFPTAENSYGLGLRSSNFGKEIMLVFDPGGQVQNKQSKGVNKFKDMIKSEEKLEEAVMRRSVGGQLGHCHDIDLHVLTKEKLLKEPSQLNKVFIVQIENSARVQGRQGNPARGKRLEVHEASRKGATITIFDPGGYLICFYDAQLVSSTPGILYIFQLQEVLGEKELSMEGKDSIVTGALSRMHDAPEISADRKLTLFDPP